MRNFLKRQASVVTAPPPANGANGTSGAPQGRHATLVSRPSASKAAPETVHPEAAQASWLKDAVSARAYSGRAELRHHNAFLKLLIFILLCLFVYREYSWRQHAGILAQQQWLVFHDNNGTTTVANASEFRTGPSDEEIRNRAWEVLRWILGAGSGNVDTAYAEAKALMTSEMQVEFEAALGSRRGQLKDLRVYRKLENVRVEPLTERHLPPGSRVRPTRYDILVTGTMDTYREGTQEKLATGTFAYHVHLVPLDRRTVDNPYGILVSEISEVNVAVPQGNPTATANTDRKEGQGTEATESQ